MAFKTLVDTAINVNFRTKQEKSIVHWSHGAATFHTYNHRSIVGGQKSEHRTSVGRLQHVGALEAPAVYPPDDYEYPQTHRTP